MSIEGWRTSLCAAAGFLLLGIPGLLSALEEAPRPPERSPNIVVILGDDLGYGELGCYGGKEIPTPNLDSMAREGVRFTDGHVSCPVCSPTRAGFITGRYQQRFGHEFNPGALRPGVEFGLPLSETTFADRMKAAGYVTGMVGKSHLGNLPAYHPLRRGFDEYFGFLGGAHPYFSVPQRAKKAATQQGNPILRGTEVVEGEEYLTDALTREALAFIRKHKEKPFFLYLAYNAVHAPLQAPAKYLDRFAQIQDTKRRTFAAMLSALDDGVGAVRAALREAGVEKDTLVFFFSDNGGPTQSTTSGNGPLRGFKGQVFEGGTRVPFIVEWKGKIPGGQTYSEPVISLDILPTALAAAKAAIPAGAALDGVNLLPHLTGAEKKPPHDFLFWRFGPQSAVRKGSWKLVKDRSRVTRLYDLATDIGESKDLAGEKPGIVKDLEAELTKWDSQLARPLWGPAQQAQRKKKQQGQ